MNQTKGRKLRWLWITLSVVIVFTAAFFIYCLDGLKAEQGALDVLNQGLPGVMTISDNEDYTLFRPEQTTATGFIFIPGGKVDYKAYAPLMAKLAQKGVLCILVHPFMNLAIMDANCADGLTELFPDITEWYIGGHSLGGLIAGRHMTSHGDEFKGLVLLASFVDKDISDLDISVLSIYGSEDGVLNMESYTEDLANLPADFTEIILEGGCHSYFGKYGIQKKDNTPTITNDEQIDYTVDAIAAWMQKG